MVHLAVLLVAAIACASVKAQSQYADIYQDSNNNLVVKAAPGKAIQLDAAQVIVGGIDIIAELAALRASSTWRAGAAVTAVPRRVAQRLRRS